MRWTIGLMDKLENCRINKTKIKNMNISRRTIIIAAAVLVAGGIGLAIGHASKKDRAEAAAIENAPTVMPLNISIMLDLSDRLIMPDMNSQVCQWEKDTAIIGQIERWFVERQVKSKFLSGDIMHVFCYPNPNIKNMAQLQDSLTIDLTVGSAKKIDAIKKNKKALKAMTGMWQRSLEKIYGSAIATKKWVGSDVWGFFDRSVKQQCVRNGYRNIIIILTDGYLYHVNSWRKTGNSEYTGILPGTVDAQTAITPIMIDLSNVEVLFMEINPKKPADFGKMRSLLTDWCTQMKIKHIEVVHTDLPRNNFPMINEFLK